MEPFEKVLEGKEPRQALATLAGVIKKLFPLVEQQDRLDFVMQLMSDGGNDKIAGMVNL